MLTKQTSCRQCGICCTKGGPAFHSADIALIQKSHIPLKDLITIRKGEFAYNPVPDKVQATGTEIVKLRGKGGEWTCCYYDPDSKGCTIYNNRPIACSALKCWAPEESLSLVETDLLSRLEIVADDVLLMDLIQEYERVCPLPEFRNISRDLLDKAEIIIADLEDLVNRDLEFRNRVVEQSATLLADEMFLFGRPLFQILQSFGMFATQHGDRLHLQHKR